MGMMGMMAFWNFIQRPPKKKFFIKKKKYIYKNIWSEKGGSQRHPIITHHIQLLFKKIEFN